VALTFGATHGHLQVGIDVWNDPPSASSTTTWVHLRVYVRMPDNWEFDDNQAINISGWGGGTGSYYNGMSNPGDTILVWAADFPADVYYGFGQTFSYNAWITGAYNGAQPTHSVSLTLPPRPPSIPNTPDIPSVSSITATGASVTWPQPGDNGAGLDRNAGQVSRNSAFTDVIQSWDSSGWTTSRNLSGLPKGTGLYVRVRAHNSVGWSDWSSARSFTTGTTPPSAPATPSVSGVTATVASVQWFAPADSGGAAITQYEIQRSTSSSLTSPTTVADTTAPTTLAGLLPGTTYYVRVRAVNSAGAGSYSSATSFRTLSGVRVGDGSTNRDAIVWVGNGSQWVMCQVKPGNGTTWN
jgi:hypothetical protein